MTYPARKMEMPRSLKVQESLAFPLVGVYNAWLTSPYNAIHEFLLDAYMAATISIPGSSL